MSSSLEHRKTDLVEQAVDFARRKRGSGRPPADEVESLLRAYYRHVAPEDVVDRSPEDLYGAVVSHYRLAEERPQGTARVRVSTPTASADGWSADGHSVVEVVTDDMPFLVDSITMELTRQEHGIHLVVHPQLEVVRDLAGHLHGVAPLEDGAADTDTATLSSVPAFADNRRESWMHVEISRLADDADAAEITTGIERVLRDVREAVEDWPRMHARVDAIVAALVDDPPPLDPDEVRQARELLEWLGEDHFTFLGYREYALVAGDDGGERLKAVPGTGYGILRSDPPMDADGVRLPAAAAEHARDKTLLVLTKANSRSTVHRPAYLDYVGVKRFVDGEVVGEQRFLGLFSSGAYTESLTRIPVLREKAAEVLRRVGFDASSHAGKALLDTLENYPRDELFHTPVDQLAPMAEEVMYTRERRRLRVFVRRDTYGRYFSVLVYLPRDRYNTSVRERFADILRERLGGESVEFTVRLNESLTARVHFVVRPPHGELIGEADGEDLERRLAEASRSWREDFAAAVTAEFGEEAASPLIRRYAASFPEAYKEDFSPRTAAGDLGRIERLTAGREGGSAGQPIDLTVSEQVDAGRGEARLKVYKLGDPVSLSVILPMLSSMGVEVVDERPYELEGLARPSHVYEFGLRYGQALPPDGRRLFDEALRAIWDRDSEVDGFNRLVLGAGLTWRQVTVLRAYAKYMRQGGTPFSQVTIEDCLAVNVGITRLLAELFEARFDPDAFGGTGAADEPARVERVTALTEQVTRALDEVASLDHDRILRSYLTIVGATLRTNFFQHTSEGRPHAYLSLKLEPDRIPDLPQPRPRYEIFVYSPSVEGVHLRFGSVARGGLRWSDRRDDFRTEVLGLVKAQMVKNTVIVPVGAKGGFYAKDLPDGSDREAWLAEGIRCYRVFVSGLLDLTDNLVEGATVPPERVVRHDGDDSYLVVAADKGTATFSDIANEVALSYGFWLGDAFASGGSVGYDHKAMGITAKGAWVSVRRHFRELGVDCQTEDFTCVGVGDMSGDVFGNGMLCSEHIRLVAAFDHRDIFLDPDPDAAASYAERRRMFALPRSSWQDYDTSLLSVGGGVFPRSLKSVPVSAQVRRSLGLADDVEHLTPAELMRAILLAPVDLLWNGGIGTYVKGSAESSAEAGDKANDAIRVDGGALRVRCVGEGGNLGLTQAGRIEYAQSGGPDQAGGRLNTDFIDNSAGVDTSDHEVNIKILLDRVVAAGDLTRKQRNALLASMTDDVAALVLHHNYAQNLALANELADAVPLLHVHEEWMKQLEKRGVLHRDIEGLPSSRQVRARLDAGRGLTDPELSVLLAWTKIVLAQDLLASDLPEDPYLRGDLFGYFPAPMRQDYRAAMESHPLRREIITTQVVNDLVDGAGITFWPRLAGETGASAAELTRANFVAREIFGSQALREVVATYDNQIPADLQTRMRLEMRTLVERASRWLATNRRPPLDSEGLVETFGVTVQRVMGDLPSLMTGRELTAYEERCDALVQGGVPKELASKVAVLPPSYPLLGLVEVATALGIDAEEATRVHFALGERLGIPALLARIVSLPRRDRWQTMARATLRDDLYAVHVQLTRQVLESTPAEESAPARVADWEEADADVVARAAGTLEEICTDDEADLARMSVGLRIVRSLLA